MRFFKQNDVSENRVQEPAYGPAQWAGLEPEAVIVALGSRLAGLNKAEVTERLARYGNNTLPRLQRRPLSIQTFRQATDGEWKTSNAN